MRSFVVIVLISLLAFSAIDASERTARRVGTPDKSILPQNRIAEADDMDDTLAYGDWELLNYFWTIPDIGGYGDGFYNVRFTPPEGVERFSLLEAHIPLFDLFGETGTPGMSVIVWQSGEQGDEPGYPDEEIDHVDVEYSDLEFSSVSGDRIVPVYNVIDLRNLEISFNDNVDFHVGVHLISDEETDSLTVISDDGEDAPTDRSIIWNGENEEWSKMQDIRIEGGYYGFNFVIRVVIEIPEQDAPIILDPSRAVPETVTIMPAFPNPFNSQTSFQFNVKNGLPYNILLTDPMGRNIRTLATGIGQGDERLNLIGTGLPAGVFYIQLTAGGSTAARQVSYIK